MQIKKTFILEEGGTLHFGRNLQVGREPAFWEEILDSNFIEILQV